MLSLLSRAAQIKKLCRCPWCLLLAHGVAERVSAAESVLRPQYKRSSRVWFTCKVGGDVNSWAGQQWIRAIDGNSSAELRRGSSDEDETLNDAAGPQEALIEEYSTAGVHEANDGRDSRPYNVTASIDTVSTDHIDNADELQAELERNLDSTAERQYVPTWPTNTGPQLNAHHLPPQSIYAPQRLKRRAAKARWYEKKMLRVQLSMDLLQLKFFIWLNARGCTHRFVSSVPEPYAALVLQHPHALQSAFEQKKSDFDRLLSTHKDENGRYVFARSSGDVPLCHYTEDDLGTFRHQQRGLQQSIKHVFDHLHERNIAETDGAGADWEFRMRGLVEIFWLLSASPAPPSLDVYNTLINGLRKERHPQLTESVISCFLSSRIRPNEVSLASILGFYTDTDNVERFRRWISLMRGDLGGLMASNPWNWRLKASNGRIKEREDKPGNFIQLPHPTPIVFDALVNGVLHFSGFGAALDLCRILSNEGWGTDMRGFGILLNDCAVRGDWNSGLAIWNQILTLKQNSAKLVDGRIKSETIMTPLFADMLRLCRRCGKKDEFADVWKQASKTHPKAVERIMEIVKAEAATPNRRSGGDEVNATANPNAAAAANAANHREQALEALATLRAQRIDSSTNHALQQEYLALQADVDFLKAMENKEATTPKARTWFELAKSAYSLIASHPQTLERRTSHHRTARPVADGDRPRATSYSDMAKNAYHLIADHPSTLVRRTMEPRPRDSVPRFTGQITPFEPAAVRSDESSTTVASSQAADQELFSGKSSQQAVREPVTYASLVRNAYHLIADHPSTLQPREPMPGVKRNSELADADGVLPSHASECKESPRDAPSVTMAQLQGRERRSDELDDYEAGERPMNHRRS